MRSLIAICLALLLIGPACAQSTTEMAPYAAALNKVARAVDAAANNSSYDSLDGDELLKAATRHDRTLLQPFSGFKLKARRVGGSSSVLMCDADETRALLEDSGCSMKLDAPRFQKQEPCEFALPIEQVCR